MSILVTGASGAVGSHLAKRLLDQGHEVVSFLHDDRPFDTARLIGIRDRVTWVRGSLLDANLVRRVVADYNLDAIFHLAALPIVQVGTRTTIPIFETNLNGTLTLLEAIRENAHVGKHIRFTFLGTDKEYGDCGSRPYTEDMPLRALGVYECSKAAADMAVRTYAHCGFAPAVAVARGCNIIAPGDLNFGRIFPRTIIPALRGESPRLYRPPKQLREYMFVDDAVEALLALDATLKMAPKLAHGEAFNIGSGHQRSLEEVVHAVLTHFPGIAPTWYDPPNISKIEIPFQRLDTSKIQRTCNWTARISFEDTIARLVNWWREHFDRLPLAIRNFKIEGWHA